MLRSILAGSRYAEVVSWNGSNRILALGGAIGLVLFALGYTLNKSNKASIEAKSKPVEEEATPE